MSDSWTLPSPPDFAGSGLFDFSLAKSLNTKYYLHLKVPFHSDLNNAVVLPPVQTVTKNRQEASSLEWTFGPNPIREHAGIRQQMITMTGRSGLAHRLGSKGDSQGDLFSSGPKLFREIEKFFEGYQKLSAEKQIVGGEAVKPILELHLVQEQKHYKVEPKRFEWRKDISTARHTYMWTMEFLAYGNAEVPTPNILGAIQDIGEQISDMIDSITAYSEKLASVLRDVEGAAKGFFFSIITAVGRMAASLGSIMSATAGILNFPKNLANHVLKTIETATQKIYNGYYQIEAAVGAYQDRSALISVLESPHEARVEVLKSFGVLGFQFDSESAKAQKGYSPTVGAYVLNTLDASLDAATVTNYEKFAVGSGTAADFSFYEYPVIGSDVSGGLGVIAEKFYGDAGAWVVIAEANGMLDQFTLPNGAPLKAGQVILIPKLPGIQLPLSASTEDYGIDLKLGQDGDLVMLNTDNDHLSTITGAPNLKQALTLRLLTVEGQSGMFPSYGLPKFVAEKSSANMVGMAAGSIRTQLLADPRIAEIDEVVVVDGGDRLIVECRAHAVGSKPIDIAAPLPTLQ